MTAFPDHYATLGIDPTADQEVITAAYRALAKKYHPDTGAPRGTASAERFAEIQQAYEVLGSAESRRQYDLELLEATRRELDEHLAAKQRKLEGATGTAAAPEPPPAAPDLGEIRPEPRKTAAPPPKRPSGLREMGPFMVVSLLLMAVLGGVASLFVGQAPSPPLEEPPLPQVQAEAEPTAPPPAPAPAPQAQPKPAATPAPAQQAAEPQDNEEMPLFGSSVTDEAAEMPPPPPEEEEAMAEPQPLPAPVPKARPAASVTVKPPPPPRTEARAARFSVVIYERHRSGDVIEEQGGVLFTSQARCAQFGENAVLRRLAPYEGEPLRPRIWYECRQSR